MEIYIGGSICKTFNDTLKDAASHHEKRIVAVTFWNLVKNSASSDETRKLAQNMVDVLNACTYNYEEQEVVAVSTYPPKDQDYDENELPPDILEDMLRHSVPVAKGKEKEEVTEEDYGQIPCEDLANLSLKGCKIGTVNGEGGRILKLTRYNDGLPPGIDPPDIEPVDEDDNIVSG